MNDLLSLLQILGATALLVVPPILLARFIAGSEPASLAQLLRANFEIPRPAGVQEEDQPAFRFDRPDDRRHLRPVETADASCLENRDSSTSVEERAA